MWGIPPHPPTRKLVNMIYMCSGKTGSGKSATAVKIVYKMWKNGRDVWSNTPLFFTEFNNGFGGENIVDNPEYFTIWEKYGKTLGLKWLSKLFKSKERTLHRGKINYFETIDETFHIKDAVILFDEGQTLFRNYDWEQVPRLFLYKLEQNRKHGLDLVTTAQRMKAVNINYRELIQHWSHFESLLPEWLESKLKIHLYKQYYMDSDLVTEQYLNMALLLNPVKDKDGNIISQKGYEKTKLRLLGRWQKKLYDTMYDIGFEPFQHYTIKIGNEEVKLHLESGMSVKQAIQIISTYKRLLTI